MSPNPPVRGEKALRAAERAVLRLDAGLRKGLPDELNPLLQTGAIANLSLVLATISGVLLLFWYSPSVHSAYDSVVAMGEQRFGAGLVRSVHRYSSDAAILFALLHAARLFFARRFGGPRWLAWVTGWAALGVLWIVGWLGYWLVWDQRGYDVAVGTAKVLDVLPIFADPLARSFVSAESTGSLLFFVVFFGHMLVPVAGGLFLWLHLARLSRSKWITNKVLSVWVVVCTLSISVLVPADVVAPADAGVMASSYVMDAWYLFPIVMLHRLSAAGVWLASLVFGVAVTCVPWVLARKQAAPAEVNVGRCNACQKCYTDCPYEAIQMVPRSDGSKLYDRQAQVDPSICMSCGICAGSCDTAGVGVPWLTALSVRKEVDAQLELEPGAHVAFVCREARGRAALEGYHVVELPCAGWLHPLTVERALKHGAGGVLVVRCTEGACAFREGAAWTAQRMAGEREPALRPDKVDVERVRVVDADASAPAELDARAAGFRGGTAAAGASRWRGLGVAAAVLATAVVWAGSVLPYGAPSVDTAELVVSFKHAGEVSEDCRTLSDEENPARPVHMQQDEVCERTRAPVRLAVSVDGEELSHESYAPSGLWGDGSSVAIARIPVPPGEHTLEVVIGDTHDGSWRDVDERTVTLEAGRRVSVVWDRMQGFAWGGVEE